MAKSTRCFGGRLPAHAFTPNRGLSRLAHAGILAACSALLMGAAVIKIQTPTGTLVLEFESTAGNVPVISVSQEGKVAVETADGELILEIVGDAETQSFHITDGKFKARATELSISAGPGQNITVRLEPPQLISPASADEVLQVQRTWAARLGQPVASENSIGMAFRLIPPGRFQMGSPDDEVRQLTANESNEYWKKYYHSESPRHAVTISTPFELGEHHVTRGQFRQFVEQTGFKTDAEQDGHGGYSLARWERSSDVAWHSTPGLSQTDDHPVINVSWNDAVAFCEWLSHQEGRRYFLPTEAQWEYACRAGTESRWTVPDDQADSLNEYAWFRSNERNTAPVGERRANPFGLHDMHGNAYEWVEDWYADDAYRNSSATNPQGPDYGEYKVIRGGSFWALERNIRSAHRNALEPTGRTPFVGFRVARESKTD